MPPATTNYHHPIFYDTSMGPATSNGKCQRQSFNRWKEWRVNPLFAGLGLDLTWNQYQYRFTEMLTVYVKVISASCSMDYEPFYKFVTTRLFYRTEIRVQGDTGPDHVVSWYPQHQQVWHVERISVYEIPEPGSGVSKVELTVKNVGSWTTPLT